MAQILVRNVDEEIVARLKQRAANNGRSLQAEVKMVLEQASGIDTINVWQKVEQFRTKMQKSGQTFSDSAALLREDRER